MIRVQTEAACKEFGAKHVTIKVDLWGRHVHSVVTRSTHLKPLDETNAGWYKSPSFTRKEKSNFIWAWPQTGSFNMVSSVIIIQGILILQLPTGLQLSRLLFCFVFVKAKRGFGLNPWNPMLRIHLVMGYHRARLGRVYAIFKTVHGRFCEVTAAQPLSGKRGACWQHPIFVWFVYTSLLLQQPFRNLSGFKIWAVKLKVPVGFGKASEPSLWKAFNTDLHSRHYKGSWPF